MCSGLRRLLRLPAVAGAKGYRQELAEKPGSVEIHIQLGDCLAGKGDFRGASEAFAKAVALDRLDPATRMKLALLLEFQGRIDEAITVLQKGFELVNENKRADIAVKFKEHIEYLKNKKSQIRR